MSRPDEWITGPVSDEVRSRARMMRIERDLDPTIAGYDQVIDHQPRELGEIGELCLARWFDRQGVAHEWLTDNVLTQPDFLVGGQAIDVKTRNRKYAQPHYTFGLQGFCLYKHAEWFCFAGYEEEKNMLTFYGMAHRYQLLHGARIVQPGEVVHNGHALRTRDTTFELPIAELIGLHMWIERTALYVSRAGTRLHAPANAAAE